MGGAAQALRIFRAVLLGLVPPLFLVVMPLVDPEGSGWIATRVEPMTIPLTFTIMLALAVQFDRMLANGCGDPVPAREGPAGAVG